MLVDAKENKSELIGIDAKGAFVPHGGHDSSSAAHNAYDNEGRIQTVVIETAEDQHLLIRTHIQEQFSVLCKDINARLSTFDEGLRSVHGMRDVPGRTAPIPSLRHGVPSRGDVYHPPSDSHGGGTCCTPKESHAVSEATRAGHEGLGREHILEKAEPPKYFKQQSFLPTLSNGLHDASEVYRSGAQKMKKPGLFEICITILIVATFATLFVESQLQSYERASELEMDQAIRRDAIRQARAILYICEIILSTAFVVELGEHLRRHGLKWLRKPFHLLDASVILFCASAVLILRPLGLHTWNLGVLRILRVVRIIQQLNMFRFTVTNQELRVLINSLQASLRSLMWSTLLLAVIIATAGILMSQLLERVIMDDSYDKDLREWCFRYYGNAARATYTMFEATFSGGWPNYSRRLVEEVSAVFSVFWVGYVLAVSFAVVRVVAAMYLKQTMQVATSDQEMLIMHKVKEREEYAKKLYEFFKRMDTSGDGYLTPDEFSVALADSTVISWLQVLDLEVYEVTALFNMLDDGDGLVSFEEFLGGAVRLKGNARSVDAVAIMHEQHKNAKLIHHCESQLRLLMDLCQTQPESCNGMTSKEDS